MTRIALAALLTMFGVTIGCRSGGEVETEPEEEAAVGEPVGEPVVSRVDTPPRWRAAIERTDPTLGINGEAVVNVGETSTYAEIDIEGAQAGAVHPWHVHQGNCGSGGAIVGGASAYPLLRVNENGEAEATATIDQAVDREADYHVNVHLSEPQSDSIIACGELVSMHGTPE